MASKLVSPRDIRLLADNVACVETIGELRIKQGLICPRCGSAQIHIASLRPGGGRINPQFRCLECDYIIAVTAGSFAMGARMMLKQYVQVLTLTNAFEGAVPKAEASLAIGIRSRAGINNVLERIRAVDPGVRFAFIDPARAEALQTQQHPPDTHGSEAFFAFCDKRSIVVDPDAMLSALGLIFNTPVRELIESFRKRGRPYATRPKPQRPEGDTVTHETIRHEPRRSGSAFVEKADDAGGIHTFRKALAQQWLARFAESLPNSSTKQRVALAWQLAALGVDTDLQLLSLEPIDLMPTSLRKPVFIELRSEYLQSKDLA